MSGADEILKGIRALDFTHGGVGPLTMKGLADAGAEVIKIETSTRIEVARRDKPYKQAIPDIDESAQFGVYNNNKLGITLNLRKPKALELVKQLVAISDVVGDSFTPGVMDRLGLGYEDLRKIKPDIIAISMSYMGKTGPAHMYRGHGPILQAQVGLSELTGWPDRRPMAPSVAYTDYYAPQIWISALMAALIYRKKTGLGQFIDGSDFEAAIDILDTTLLDFTVNRRVATRRGNHDTTVAPHGCYPCAGEDRWCTIAVLDDEAWRGLCKAVGEPDWATEERFATFAERRRHQDELDELIGTWTRRHTAEDVMANLQEHGVAAGVVQNARDFHQDAQLRHRGHYWELADDPDKQWFTYESPGYHLSRTPLGLRRRHPHIGEHNSYVFCELLGLCDEDFAQLIAEGVLE